MNKHNYFIGIAKAVALGSKDPSSKVGALIVTKDGTPVSFGYNGFIAGADKSKFTWERPMKYQYVIHAEENALLFAKQDLSNCKAYVTEAPCERCLKLLIQAKVTEIWYESCSIMKRASEPQKEAIKAILEATGAKVKNISGIEYLEELNEEKM